MLKSKNEFLEYYGKHKISPVHQNINDLSVHYERRRKLYRQCGIPLQAFRNAEILEVGPGSGYNTLAVFHFLRTFKADNDPRGGHVTLVEPNPRGIKDMETLFEAHSISKDEYQIFPCQIEDFPSDKRFDFVFAEGFIQCLENAQELIRRLAELVKINGILLFTCYDDVGMFIEAVKRLLGVILTHKIDDYDSKVEMLVSVFAPQLKQLRGVSRPARDWVQDMILNPIGINGCDLTMSEAIDAVGDNFYMLGASPHMFTDYSWYKDIYYDTKQSFKEQFRQKHMSLLMAGMPESILSLEDANILGENFKGFRFFANEYEKTGNAKFLKDMQVLLTDMDIQISQLPKGFVLVFQEIKNLLQEVITGEIHMERYPHFCAAFGRSLQYMAFERCEDWEEN